MISPLPTQLSGARWLSGKHRALLADAPRVGKTGTAILAADYLLIKTIDVVTTASGRAVWRQAFKTWSKMPRTVAVMGVDKNADDADVRIHSWGSIIKFADKRNTQLVIADEAHRAKNPASKCTESLYGKFYDETLLNDNAMVKPSTLCWQLTGTPLPHDPGDLWTHMRAACPERLKADKKKGWPRIFSFDDFRERYCVIRFKNIKGFYGRRKIPVVIGGRNVEELHARVGDYMLRRTQKDIGIRPPVYELMPLIVSEKQKLEAFNNANQKAILEAAERGDTKKLEMELGPLRRITGAIKAKAVVEAAKEELEDGLEKIVLFFWHREVGDILEAGLQKFGVVRLDGLTTARERELAEENFRELPNVRVFLGQIQAAGEAIDLSSSQTLWFVESSMTPAHMAQAALRVTNINQKANPIVRVCVLENTIDENLQASLLRLWTAINGVVK